ncbi:hypothetical protein OBBRIDRAFT_383909 [Obba rivulosa]|uniref:G domain-containing protein n=1 Tax=Obba rivulosa TaxID=1052685 RepID=A0A8E2AMT3_9APHY|nr:hypothetical protein OBBRIDRAFT_383909 [Obba rivulosa]
MFANTISAEQRPMSVFYNEGTQREVRIAVMGASGTGKSTFINLLSNSNIRTSSGLDSCTETVELSETFTFDGRAVRLIDTPGFDDSTKSDVEILGTIANFLASQYRDGLKLSGVIYMQRITDPRMGGVARRNFTMFNKLCGTDFMENVVLATTRWNEVEPAVGRAREAELKAKDVFFKPALDAGAHYMRHDKNLASARDIIRYILKESSPEALFIQKEIVDQRKAVSDTSAGKELRKEIAAQIEKQTEEMHELKKQMKEALKERDDEARQDLDDDMREQRSLLARLKAQVMQLSATCRSDSPLLQVPREDASMDWDEGSTLDSIVSHVDGSTPVSPGRVSANAEVLSTSAFVTPSSAPSLLPTHAMSPSPHRNMSEHITTQGSPKEARSPGFAPVYGSSLTATTGGDIDAFFRDIFEAPQPDSAGASHKSISPVRSKQVPVLRPLSPVGVERGSTMTSGTAQESALVHGEIMELINDQIRLLKVLKEDLDRAWLEAEGQRQVTRSTR